MYRKDLLKDWSCPHLTKCGWYLDCPKDGTSSLEVSLCESFELGFTRRLQRPLCLKVPKNQGMPLRRKVRRNLQPQKLWLTQRGPIMIFRRTWLSINKHHLPKLLMQFCCPPVIVTEEKPPLFSHVFIFSKRTRFFIRALNLSWHSIACNQLKNMKWLVEKGQISCIMKEVISIDISIFEFVSSPFMSMTLTLKI